MTTGRFGNHYVEGWLDEVEALTLFGALFFSDPHATDPLTVEVVGGDYDRADLPTERVAFNVLRNSGLLVWRNLLPGTHIAYVGAFDDATSGNLVAAGALAVPVDLLSGGNWALPATEFQMGMDVALGP